MKLVLDTEELAELLIGALIAKGFSNVESLSFDLDGDIVVSLEQVQGLNVQLS